MARPIWLWWSSGKDSAWALHELLDDPSVHVTGLVTTVDAETGRVPMQGTGADLLELQAASTGIEWQRFALPTPCPDQIYRDALRAIVARAREEKVTQMAFGDLHLADVRAWRDSAFAALGCTTLYPLWQRPTPALARHMIDEGLRAVITCVDTRVLEPRWLGRPFDHGFLDSLPRSVDPCGENGEFHTFVTAGPMLHDAFDVHCGPVQSDGCFCWVEPVLQMPIDGTLDLHGVPPREVGDLVDDYLDACRDRGITHLRIVHGKGIGALRETVHARLRRRDDVLGFGPGGEGRGSWGATLVDLAPKNEKA